ncbi:hypothetical protein [uncultured Microscilla sp.]|uniref:hypothetical protein n=1 Tax=uncultured Microscilla sp. TaxID=432653 RepID=UPI00260F129F|nr:hypothetical protein [uncultured Microscilla sp.]
MIAGIFGFIFWFARRATQNNHQQIALLADHFKLELVRPSKSFWVLPELRGNLKGMPLEITVKPNAATEGNELRAVFTVPRQHFSFTIQRKTKLTYNKNDIELMDGRINDHFIIKTEQPIPTKAFLQKSEIKQALAELKEHCILGAPVVLYQNEVFYTMNFAGVTNKKRDKIIKAIEFAALLATLLQSET